MKNKKSFQHIKQKRETCLRNKTKTKIMIRDHSIKNNLETEKERKNCQI